MTYLRDYQQAQVRTVCQAARRGDRRIVVCSPTGTGKTETQSELFRIARYPLSVVPRVNLMRQQADRFALRLGEQCDIEQGGMRAESMDGLRRRIIVGSRDSLLSNRRYRGKAYERVTLVCVDECHIGISDRMIEMMEWFEQRGATIVGFSATPYKGKGKPLRYWPRPQSVYSLMAALSDGWLVPPKCFLSESKALDMTLVDEVEGEWDKRQLHAVLTAEHYAQEVTSLVLSTYKSQPSVVYASSVAQARLLMDVFARYSAPAAIVHSRQDIAERNANMGAFTAGEAKIIVNVGVLSFGWDFPELRNIYMAAPTLSLSGYEQKLGRGTRPLPGVLHPEMSRDQRLAAIAASDKPHFNIYDITDSSRSTQLLDALTVLDYKARKNPKRRERNTAELGAEGVDALDAIQRADEWELAILEQQTRELMEKRKRLIVGVTFDHETRDLFSEPEGRKKRGWRMMYGQYKGQPLSSLPASYLSWVLGSQRQDTPFKSAVARELQSRQRASKPR